MENSSLPSLKNIPEDIADQLRFLIHESQDAVTGEWLTDLVVNSGHLTTADHLRWRSVALVWLAAKFDLEAAWPYLMWFNQGEPVIGEHLTDIITDGVNDMQCYVQLATWLEGADERLQHFFSSFDNVPTSYRMAPVLERLLPRAKDEAVGLWLAEVARETSDHPSAQMRPWHLLAATWYGTCFESVVGLDHLRADSNGAISLSADDVRLLTEAAEEINGVNHLRQWIAECGDPALQTMVAEVGHPHPEAIANNIFEVDPAYDHLQERTSQAERDAQAFATVKSQLEQANVTAKGSKILDLACSELAPQTLLLNSAGYTVTGADLAIPPDYLPVGLMQRFKKGKYVKAWQTATSDYYTALERAAGNALNWRRAKVELTDPTKLSFGDKSFDVVVCIGTLQHTPAVADLLDEAARVLKPGGLLLADIHPFATLDGSFTGNAPVPWAHLRGWTLANPDPYLNQWREQAFRTALDERFTVEQWITSQSEAAQAALTDEVRAELSDYEDDELTRDAIFVVARKK